MKFLDLSRRATRSLRSAKGRTALTALAISIGAFTLTLTLAASNGAQAYISKIIADNFDPSELQVSRDETVFGGGDATKPREYSDSFVDSLSGASAKTQIELLTEADINQLRSYPEVESVREEVTVNFKYITAPGQKKYIATARAYNPFVKPKLVAGTMPTNLNAQDVLLPEAFVSALGFKDTQSAVGEEITAVVASPLQPQTGVAPIAQESKFKIIGVLKKPNSTEAQPGTELYLLTSRQAILTLNDVASAGTSNYRKYLYAAVKIKDGLDESKLESAQSKIKNAGFIAQSTQDTQKFLNQIIGILRGIVITFGLFTLIASVFGIINTMYISVLQRIREIGLMKALGMRNRDVGALFRIEAASIGLIGGLLGSAMAYALGVAINPRITEALSLDSSTRLLIFEPLQVLGLLALLVAVSVLSGWLPSRKAAKLDPIEALRTE